MTFTYPPCANNQPIQSIAVGSSPFTWQNTNPYPVRVIIFGGTLSAIQMSRDGTNFDSVGAGASIVPLSQGDYVKITYVLIPTNMLAVPS